MVQRPRCDTIELLESSRRVLSVRENMPAFAEHAAIQIEQRAPESDVRLGVVKIAVRCAAQLVSRAVLVDDPCHLARMPREVRGKPRRNQQIDRREIC